ncbi:nephrin-like [Littorina saxatilis]|uniref:Uncharacterized protein n=1 Tax=Littorina saxatilis TaxID=31220 RepID=A0AAN9BHL3_9CAEN
MEKAGSLLLLCLLCVLWKDAACSLGEPMLKKAGDDAVLQWNLPKSTDATIITVALQLDGGTRAIFYGSTTEANQIKVDELYADRVDVLDSLSVDPGIVTFTLKNVAAADAGRYVCINGFGDEPIIPDCGQMLVIVDTPVNTTISASTAAVENQDLTLECDAASTSLPPDHGLTLQVQWFDSAGTKVSSNQEKVEVDGRRLLVRSIQRQDNGLQFTCRASDGMDIWSEQSAPFTVVPEYGPTKNDIELSRHSLAVNQGGSLQQQCSAECNPDCVVTWRKKNQQGNWYDVQVDGVLDIPSVRRDNSGVYRCYAENVHGSEYRTFKVDVRYSPNLQNSLVNGVVVNKTHSRPFSEGHNVTITCHFDSNPAPKVRWFRHQDKDVTLKEQSLEDQRPVVTTENSFPRITYTSQFALPNAQCSDTSNYVCTASNELGSGSDGLIPLRIKCMPRNTHGEQSLKNMYLSPANQAFTVTFQVEAFPPPEITRIISENSRGHRQVEVRGSSWTLNTMSQSTHQYLTTFRLSMPNLTPDYFDKTYYMNIDNTEGLKVLAFQLRERGPPKPPKNVTAKWSDDSQVHLHWIPGFHGGKPQRFTVHYQHSDVDEDVDHSWHSVPAQYEETLEEQRKEMTLGGLKPGTPYNILVTATNEYGSTNSTVLKVTTMATAAASADAGAIAGAVIGVIIVLVIIAVIVFIFVIRPRRKKNKESKDDSTKEPMLASNDEKTGGVSTLHTVKEKPVTSPPPDLVNNNANTEPSSPTPAAAEKPRVEGTENRIKNADGLIYADLDLDKSKDAKPPPERKDAVNYETIDFTRTAPHATPDIELASDEEELPSKN